MIFFQIYRTNCRSTCIAKATNSCKAVKWFIPITRILSFDFQHMEATVTVLGIDCPMTYTLKNSETRADLCFVDARSLTTNYNMGCYYAPPSYKGHSLFMLAPKPVTIISWLHTVIHVHVAIAG